MYRLLAGSVLFVTLAIPPIRIWLETYMITHMLVQMPLLILSGIMIGNYLIKKYLRIFEKYDGSGISGIVLVFIVTMFWMIPRTMDEALMIPQVEIFKYISLPFLVGIPLSHSWRRLKMIGKGFVIFNYIPMFGMMAWLYIDSPIQVCNNYLESEQKLLGWGFLFIMLCMLLYILQLAFIDHRRDEGMSVE